MERVSTAHLETICSESNINNSTSITVGRGEKRVEIEVKHRLNMDDVTKLVSEVCEGVFDTNKKVYRPELQDFYLRKAVLENYTNLDLPQNKECWELVYGTPVFAMVTGHDKRPVIFNGREYDDNLVIDTDQYEQIISAINMKISYILNHIG